MYIFAHDGTYFESLFRITLGSTSHPRSHFGLVPLDPLGVKGFQMTMLIAIYPQSGNTDICSHRDGKCKSWLGKK